MFGHFWPMYCTSNTSALRLHFFLLAYTVSLTVFVLLNILSVAPTVWTFHYTRRSHLLHHLRVTWIPRIRSGSRWRKLCRHCSILLFCGSINVCSTLFCGKISVSRDYVVEWGSRNSAVGLRAGCESWQGQYTYLFSKTSTPALGRNQPPIQWLPRAFSPGGKAAGEWGWPLVPRFRMSRTVLFFFFWCFADHASEYNLSNWRT